ncbi:MAG: UDP-N-acetylmuramoyl-L-alanyl-D-glutamate--2,6-diaminopimelate ligase [Bdellovibrionaceae bacterium]|mgnify:FL=1|nr:UDP-N-acetylmuramoyl-L-alanyl-D-glutamate--2,6-diaminopimelate ligase [Pseudobdellovibrionaceae bacterium]
MKFSEFIVFFPPNSVVFPKKSQSRSVKITQIVDSSHKATQSSVFFAIKGSSSDGHKYIKDAIKKGAILIVLENSDFISEIKSTPYILVSDTRRYYEKMCSLFFGRQDEWMFNVGVTGTNGKTSTTYIIEYLLQSHGIKTGVIGTVNHRVGKKVWPTSHTTPDPWTVHSRYKDFKKQGAQATAVEITSHGIDQKRMHSVNFDIGIFTNLTQDHLDYHGTMENYFSVKEKLFTELLAQSSKLSKFALINGDDGYGQKLKTHSTVTPYFYGMNKKFPIWFEVREKSFEYQKLEIGYFGKTYTMKFPLLGDHNIYNFISTLFVCEYLKIPIQSAIKKMEAFAGIPGRLQRVQEVRRKNVFVDFAHTPDAVAKTIETVRELRSELKSNSRIITVFGCGGDRDTTKRPIMGKIAEDKSDIVIVTSDNPRTEDPAAIIEQIKSGFKNSTDKLFEVNRSLAIQKAMEISKSGDIVLVLGKGHEKYQIIGDKTRPFDDYKEVIKHAK